MTKMYLKIENQYFGPVISYMTLIKSSHVDLCAYDPYEKASFRNRCTLPGANGAINLSVPVKGGRDQKTLFKDVKIDNGDEWQKKHWRTIFSVYGKSPWFNFFSHELEALFNTPKTYLFDWDLACFEWVKNKLRLNIEFAVMGKSGVEENKWTDLKDHFLPATVNTFKATAVEYTQVFGHRNGFSPNMSILDLICCEGKNAREILHQSPLREG